MLSDADVDVYLDNSMDEAWSKWEQTFMSVMSQCIPTMTVRLKLRQSTLAITRCAQGYQIPKQFLQTSPEDWKGGAPGLLQAEKEQSSKYD